MIVATATAKTAHPSNAHAACAQLDNATKPADVDATPMPSDSAVTGENTRK